MTGALVFALLAASPRPALVSVHALAVEGRGALEVVTTTAPVRVRLDRVDGGVALTLDVDLPRDLGAVAAVPPLRTVEVARAPGGVVVRVGLDGEVPYEVRRQGTLLTVLFGAAATPAGEEAHSTAAGVQDLYRGLMPPPVTTSDPVPSGPVEAAASDANRSAVETEGLHLGLLTLRPQVSGAYVDAEGALLETAAPLPDQYYEVRPRIAGEMPFGTGRLQADYEARVRRGSQFAEVDEATTHMANADLELPLGSSVLWRAAGHFSQGLLETTEVDPGREYFFRLGRYRRYDASTGLRIETGGRFDLDFSAAGRHVDVDENSGFFDHEGWTASGGLGIELTPRLRAVFGYSYEEIPPDGTDRVEARMQAHLATANLQGEILPLVTGFITLAYRDQRNPEAGEGGQRYQGLAASVRLLKEFSRSTTLQISAGRSTPPSNFEDNGFFVATSVLGELNLGLPLSVTGLAGAGYHRNDYRVVAPEIGEPREDHITTWFVGLGRPLTDWAFVRADYRFERRESNIEGFDTDGHAFTVQVGLRLYRPRGGR